MQRRNDSITISKAIGIILMVIGHAGCPSEMYRFIYMFHMPLFFFVSGYCFKEKYLETPKDFLLRKVKGIYLPFVKWCILFLLLHNIFFALNIYNGQYGHHGTISELYSWIDILKRVVLICCNMDGFEILLSGFWFLKQLLIGSIIMFACVKTLKISILAMGYDSYRINL